QFGQHIGEAAQEGAGPDFGRARLASGIALNLLHQKFEAAALIGADDAPDGRKRAYGLGS
nr:hypothetical protein [Tanacetum cinerariifolium]